MADRICEIITPSQRDKSSFEEKIQIHGSVIDKRIEDFEELKEWVKKRLESHYLWTPE